MATSQKKRPEKKLSFQIYTMYFNRKDLLEVAIRSLGHFTSQLVILDNSPEQTLTLSNFDGEIFTPSVPLYCNQSYNLIQQIAEQRGQDVFFIMHSDARVSPAAIEGMLLRAQELNHLGRPWGVLFTSSSGSSGNLDVLCLMNAPLIKGIHWDHFLPLYYTDVDYYYRLKLAGLELIETYIPVEHLEGGSATQSDPQVKTFVEANYPAWRHYYMLKWGGDNGSERFTTPFDRHED